MSDERVQTSHPKWRGLKALIHDAVEHGSRAVEKIHLETARRPFAILEQIPLVAEPSKIVHEVYDAVVTSSYSAVRLVNSVVASAGDLALDLLADDEGPPPAD